MSEQREEITYPSIVFKVSDNYYALNSKNVATIMQMPKCELLPDAPDNVIGIFTYRDKVVPVVDVRLLFGMKTLEQEYEAFAEMIEQRKKEHLSWAQEFKRCLKEGERFTLTTDPHKCSLGRWLDNIDTNLEISDNAVGAHLKKIQEPHKLLHQAAAEAETCIKSNSNDTDQERTCLNSILYKVQNTYVPTILQLLDDSKEYFKTAYRAMAIVVDNGTEAFALIVDEVLSVENLEDVADEEKVDKLHGSKYLSEIKKSPKINRLILMLDDTRLEEIARSYELQEKMAVGK